MNILIVDGNEKEASDRYVNLGMATQYEVYSNILQKLANNNLNISIIHPAVLNNSQCEEEFSKLMSNLEEITSNL